MPLICATTPYSDDDVLRSCVAQESLPPSFAAFSYRATLGALTGGAHMEAHGRDFGTESSLRNFGRLHAQQIDARWWLQLDADERLVNGEQLTDILTSSPYRYSVRAYPLPRLEESGAVSICPYKLVRLPAELVAGCDHFRFPFWTGPVVWRLSADRSATEQEIPALLQGPHLIHEPSLRPAGARPRLGTLENVLETRPPNAVEWPLPLTHRAGSAV